MKNSIEDNKDGVKKLKLMLVEDNIPSALLLTRMLEKHGYAVAGVCHSGEDAISQVEDIGPDLILMDIILPGDRDGIDTASEIYEKLNIPFIYITSTIDQETIERAKKTNPYGYIIKPYNINMIHAAVELAIHKHNSENQLRKSEKRTREMLKASPDIMFHLDSSGCFAEKEDDLAGSDWWNSEIASKAAPLVKKVMKTKEPAVFEYSIEKNGVQTYLETRLLSTNKNRVLAVLRDITDKKKVEAELQEYRNNLEGIVQKRTEEISKTNRSLISEMGMRTAIENNMKVFRCAVEQNPELIIVIEAPDRLYYVNSQFTRVFGYTSDELTGRNIDGPESLLFREPGLWREISSSELWRGEIEGVSSSGEIKYINASVSKLYDENNRITHYIISGQDITVRKMDSIKIESLRRDLTEIYNNSLEKETDWMEWQEKINTRSIMRSERSLFRNINDSFTQGAGFGTLTSMLQLMASTSKREGGKLIVDSEIYETVEYNRQIAVNAFKLFTSIDWVIANEFTLEKITMFELHALLKGIISKAQVYGDIENQRIVLKNYDSNIMKLSVNLNKEYFLMAVYEGLINAIKFSKQEADIFVIPDMNKRNLVISIINDPKETADGSKGIPSEYEKLVFEPFYRITKLVYEQYNCLDFGLGLTLIDKIINKHGGEVHISNISSSSQENNEPETKVNLAISIPIVEVSEGD